MTLTSRSTINAGDPGEVKARRATALAAGRDGTPPKTPPLSLSASMR